jgi:hypothetical protein
VASLMAAELGRDARWIDQQVQSFTALARQYMLGSFEAGAASKRS